MELYNASNAQGIFHEDDEIVMTFEEYEENKKALENALKCAEAARNLNKNPDFKLLIMEGYLTNEPVRLGDLMASGRLGEMGLKGAARSLAAIGEFRNYLKAFIDNGNLAEEELASLEEAYAESCKAQEKLDG